MMKFLVDENIPPSFVEFLHTLGYSSFLSSDLFPKGTDDNILFEYASKNDLIILTHDLDFSRIHAMVGTGKPSVITVRIEPMSVSLLKEILTQHLKPLKDELETGAIVIIEKKQIRVRRLPLKS
jgi:predicted nuclease of predicted toxin-antitoxin system